ncbi:hypothetical protein [Amaricoccus sp.]|uniref:hypothetical protein n=1 Tax=Amaricoccus sp. TaxID=1872485 RepID=UPI001B59F5E1|nr:hypothetical protein [Amaricoccus sp.]MBP7001428.1 hypothetical protein [Amaricoccus sp.]
MSTNYYALFHAVCRNCADCFIGGSSADRSRKAWLQAYRAIEHGNASDRCKDQSVMRRFPKAIEDFGNLFVLAQRKRHLADYDPEARFTRSEVLTDIEAADVALRAFGKAPMKDRRAFAAWVMIKGRRG